MDITEQLKREEILKYEAGYDSLTGLNNRKNAVSLMEKEFNRKRQADISSFAMLIILRV